MSECRRFEEEALERIERGLPLDAHFGNCPECLAAREEYDRLRELLSGPASKVTAPEGWQDAVWEHIDRESEVVASKGEHRRAPRWIAGAVAAASVLLAALLWIVQPVETTLIVVTEDGSDVMRRSSEVQVGSTIRIWAEVDRKRTAELRIYRDDDELLVRCSDLAPCRRVGDHLEAEQIISVRGRYEVVLFVSDSEIPAPAGSLDADVGAADQAGAKYKLSRPITAF